MQRIRHVRDAVKGCRDHGTKPAGPGDWPSDRSRKTLPAGAERLCLIGTPGAVAFFGTVEIATQLVRRSRGPHAATSVPGVPGDADQAVRAAYTASVAAGVPLSQRAVAERFGLASASRGVS
jgi:hypothetical protein